MPEETDTSNNDTSAEGAIQQTETQTPITAKLIVPNDDEQLRELRMYLATSEPFRQCRGKVGHSWLGSGIFNGLVKSERPFGESKRLVPPFPSPTAVLNELDRRHGQARVLINHLAKLLRDGHMRAFEELSFALADDRFILTGEETPLEKRTPAVLVMFNPRKMMDIIRWLQLIHPSVIDKHLGEASEMQLQCISSGRHKDRPSLQKLTEQILNENPDIKEGFAAYYKSARDEFNRNSYFFSEVAASEFEIKYTEDPFQHYLRNGGEQLFVSGERESRYDWVCNWKVACFFSNTTQAEFLSKIPRGEQKDVATWQFYYPSHISIDTYNAGIGLFPESELERFQSRWPTHTSKSLNNGMGAILLEHRHEIPVDDPMFKTETYRRQEEDPDPSKVGIKLSFLNY